MLCQYNENVINNYILNAFIDNFGKTNKINKTIYKK